jgi:hypothetical protein
VGPKVKVGIVVAGVIAAALAVIAITNGKAYTADPRSELREAGVRTASLQSHEGHLHPASSDSPTHASSQSSDNGGPGLRRVSYQERVAGHEALPCTRADEPTNFEVFSAGRSVAGVPLNTVRRNCGGVTPVDEPPGNFVNYIYGHCTVPPGASGCQPPLEVQTWPSCQRTYVDYSFEGKPIPYTELPSRNGARVFEIEFMFGNRIEVYTKSSTVVIFANNAALARKAVAELQASGDRPPAEAVKEPEGKPGEGLGPPNNLAMEGEQSC